MQFRCKEDLRKVCGSSLLPFFIVLGAFCPTAYGDYNLSAANLDQVDTSKWRCRYCPDEDGYQGYVAARLEYNKDGDDATAHYQNAVLKNDSGLVSFDAQVKVIEETAHTQISAEGLGKENASVALDHGRPGTHVDFDYSRSTQFDLEGAKSIYASPQEEALTLPSAWARQSDTAAMSLSPLTYVHSYQQRDSVIAGVSHALGEGLPTLSLTLRQQQRSGTDWTYGSILNDVVALPYERDDRIRELTVTAEQTFLAGEGRGHIGAELFGSEYENDRQSMIWQNPFTITLAGSEEGQLAREPDNRYKRWQVYGAYTHGAHRLRASYSRGSAKQQDAFLPYTRNTLLTTAALPETDYAGKVVTAHTRLSWAYRINRQWQVESRFRKDQRDNQSPKASYEPVLTDGILQSPVVNSLYNHEKTQLELDAQWRWRAATRFEYTYYFENMQRSGDAQGEADTQGLRFQWREKWSGHFNSRVSILAEERDKKRGGIESFTAGNAFAREFTLADRLRNQLDLKLGWQVTPTFALTTNALHRDDDYRPAVLGVTKAREDALGYGASWEVSRTMTADMAMQRSWSLWRMAGSTSNNLPTWQSSQKDQYDVFSIGLRHQSREAEGIELGIRYALVNTRGETDVSVPGEYHDRYSDGHTVQTYLDYPWRPAWRLRFETLYARFRSRDPMLVGIDAVSDLLSNAAIDENYSEWLFGVRVQYRLAER